ncbi:MAG: exodeoxyribonuclease VII small subunit [Clostridia bacterium]|nr:exodeoxyribonuclease VII small subunit [Clostridia bacterium]
MSGKTYEQKVAELEEIVGRLESGNVPLNEMISLYEQGIKLYEALAKQLADYEKRLNENKEKTDA